MALERSATGNDAALSPPCPPGLEVWSASLRSPDPQSCCGGWGSGGARVKANSNPDCWDWSTILLVLNVTWLGGGGRVQMGTRVKSHPIPASFPGRPL